MRERIFKSWISSLAGLAAIIGAVYASVRGADWRVCIAIAAAGVVLLGVKDKDLLFDKILAKFKGGRNA